MKVQAQITHDYEVAAIKVSAAVRYWEDGKVGESEDTDGTLMPLRNGDLWEPTIDLDTGRIRDWPEGVEADVHYKVCDAGVYTLLDAEGRTLATRDGYVPDLLSPCGSGYGDYIIMKIGADGVIADWDAEIDPDEWNWVAI
ncbi:hypothetical protein G7048_19065 [Diaphorobacter sp. HDW4B]|uniref:hypothetical protein n=1 Tax=Diaphorobacter sp. HDW4B TaxID=2714925 RepID=UPI0014095409|nr:hypothetical protein [Diaphorobacter sp. HDW4B]QIL72268.1 hypothetical protein G7048_19065 [Diaphorobacter sp. HDW4B]